MQMGQDSNKGHPINVLTVNFVNQPSEFQTLAPTTANNRRNSTSWHNRTRFCVRRVRNGITQLFLASLVICSGGFSGLEAQRRLR